ncbi:MAG: hypothetical protein QOH70_1300 [Blastocatellia bacterium]|jgi:subtilase family serine protease|nr:hypothetical protein [Blastocatellia bacterium]
MQIAVNNHTPQTGKFFWMRPLIALVAVLILIAIPVHAQTDPRSMMGSGNFNNGGGDYGTAAEQYSALTILGAKMSRMNLYPDHYWNGSAATPTAVQSAVLQAHTNNNTPMILFEYYTNLGSLGDYNKWFAIGRDFATQYRPNSPWLASQGVTGWGISVYSAINEPDAANAIPKTGTGSYYDALKGLADGVHSVDATLKVIPGGFMAENAFSDHTLRGYLPAIAPLLNDGTLDGIDLHTYNDISYAPIIMSNGTATFSFSPQSDFDSVKSASGITRDVNFYSTEFNFKNDSSQGIDENLAAKRFLTCIWANLGVVKNDGQTGATGFAFPWNIFHTASQDALYGLNTQLNPWTPRARGTTLQLVLDQTAGMDFVSRDPKGRGEFILNGNNKKMWVWQNYATWSNITGTSYNVTGIPAGATTLKVYGWDGQRGATITLSGQTSYNVTGLATNETYMFLVNAADGGSGLPDLIVTAVSWSPVSPVTGDAVTFSATIQNQGATATPAGVMHRVSFSVDGTEVNWSDTSTASLAPGASRTVTANNGPSGSSTWTAASGTHTILANVDNTNLISESNESNNTLTSSMTVTAAGQPDLIVTAISWSPASPVTGNAVTFSATIKNQGTAATPAGVVHRVSFSIDSTEVNWSDTSTTSLAAGASRTVTANNGPSGSSTWTATSGTHTILANVDNTNLIAESNESNNTLTSSMTVGSGGLPDLIVTAVTWSPASPVTGNAVTFSATIQNQGGSATPAGVIHGVEFRVDGVQVNWSDTSTASLAAGASRTVTANSGPNGGSSTWTATSGTHTILATVDDVNRISESNESNNTLTASMTVTSSGQPDLIVTAVSWSPASPVTGNAVTFSATIKNQGTAATPAGVVHRVGFSVDGTQVNWSDTSTTSLAAGASRTVTANSGPTGSSTWTATSGTHTILANVDNTNLIAESNESNNTLTSSMTVGSGGLPDLIVTAVTWSPASPVTGNAVTFSATIQNQGGSATPAGVIHGVEFRVDGVQVNWSDTSTASLAAGASRTVTANSGPNGGSSTWTATSGTHTILATVDDVNRIAESNESNNTLTASMTVGSSPSQLLLNPGFESGNVNWVATSGVISNSTSRTPNSGSWYAWLNGYGSAHTDSLYQQIAIPSTVTTATLTFYMKIDTAETTPTNANDTLKVQIRNSANTVLATLATYSNLDKGTVYVLKSFDVTAYKGTTIRVYFLGVENASLQTSFLIDDTAVTIQ